MKLCTNFASDTMATMMTAAFFGTYHWVSPINVCQKLISCNHFISNVLFFCFKNEKQIQKDG